MTVFVQCFIIARCTGACEVAATIPAEIAPARTSAVLAATSLLEKKSFSEFILQ